MGVWEGLSPSSKDTYDCDVPECTNTAIMVFLPAFESPSGWSGDKQEYDPKLEIAYVCIEHQSDRFKSADVIVPDDTWQAICAVLDDANGFYEMFDDWEGVPERMDRMQEALLLLDKVKRQGESNDSATS